jgi:phosphoribosylpyrophosphate synthetase
VTYLSGSTGLSEVRISKTGRAGSAGVQNFTVQADLTGASVVLVDDVYRTGRTFQAAVSSLRRANAEAILGLTATCAFTAVNARCQLDEVDAEPRPR